MDLGEMTFIGLVAIGVTNVVTFFKPNLDSRVKFAISFVAAFLATLVPPDTGVFLLEKAKVAITTAFMASGAYKLATRAGGN